MGDNAIVVDGKVIAVVFQTYWTLIEYDLKENTLVWTKQLQTGNSVAAQFRDFVPRGLR